MRPARLLAVLLVVLTTLTTTLLAAPAAVAEAPLRLDAHITDRAGALTRDDRSTVKFAIDKLYRDHRIRLWVVYVDDFSGQDHETWGDATRRASGLSDRDVLLAVATERREYDFRVPNAITSISPRQVDDLRLNRIEPELYDQAWASAAVAAANGLGSKPVPWGWVLVVLAVGAVVAAALMVVVRYLRRRRREAELAAARRVDATDPEALAVVPLRALDGLSKVMIVDVDNAVRTSSNELAVAIEEFGVARTGPFTAAVDGARAALAQAFTVRQTLDDAIPETPAQRRELLTRSIVAAARADRDLEAQREAFEQLRDLVINAPTRLDALRAQLVELTARLPGAADRLATLHSEFDSAALASVSGNVGTARQRVSFADTNITRARELVSRAGQQGGLVDAVRAGESALGQARALLDAVDTAADDIRHAVSALPEAITDIDADITQAEGLLGQGQRSDRHVRELRAARDAAATAVAAARSSTDPLGAFTALSKANTELDKILATVVEERATAARLGRQLQQAVFTAGARVRAVSEFIDTRRGSVGPEARTRLAEARRALESAQGAADGSAELTAAIGSANTAAALASQAQSLAQNDVAAAQRAYAGRYGGDDFGAMMGGIIIGNILGGSSSAGSRGGGWSPTSFGGSSGSGGGGGFMGGGGRF